MKLLCVFGELDLSEVHLVCGLKELGFDVLVVCCESSKFQDQLYDAGIATRYLQLKSKISPSGIVALRGIISDFEPDIVHAFTARALSTVIFSTLFSISRPKIVAYRGAVGNIGKLDPTSWISYLNPRVDAISCVSEAVCRYLIESGVKDEKLFTIYKGHDHRWYETEQLPPTREELGIAKEAIVVGCVANMRMSKGLDVLFRAIEKIKQDLPVHFLLIGKMELPKSLRARTNVTALGYRADAQVMMKLFDIVVVPSRREGLPRSLLEAMSQQVAPIVTSAGGMPEIVRNGVDGRVVPIEDYKSLAAAIREVACDREQLARFKISAKRRVVDKFSIRNTISQTAEMYQSLFE